MRSLIINADDCGFSRAVNEAIRKCLEKGAITGVSLMAGGECFREAAAMLKGAGRADVGLHLTFTGVCRPCSENKYAVASLLGKDGGFLAGYAEFGMRYFSRGIDITEVYVESRAQINRLLKEGLSITHIDSHEHVHMFPGIFKAVLDLASEFNIPYVRVPVESVSVIARKFTVKDLVRYAALRVMVSGAGKKAKSVPLKKNGAFWGHFHSGRIDDEIMSFILENLAEGVNEVAVHPAVSDAAFLGAFPWYKNGPNELEVLLNGVWKKDVQKKDVRLISHREV